MAADLSNLLRSAARLKARNGWKSGRANLPALLFLTDPGRIADPVAALERLPRSTNGRLGVVYRHFGAKNRLEIAKKLKKLCAKRRWTLLIGADAALAVRIGADGVHLPERLASKALSLKRQRPTWTVTAAVHDPKALKHSGGLDAILLSPAFPTQSPSAKGAKPLNRMGVAKAAAQTITNIYALGGVNGKTIKYIENIQGIAGGALVSGLLGNA